MDEANEVTRPFLTGSVTVRPGAVVVIGLQAAVSANDATWIEAKLTESILGLGGAIVIGGSKQPFVAVINVEVTDAGRA